MNQELVRAISEGGEYWTEMHELCMKYEALTTALRDKFGHGREEFCDDEVDEAVKAKFFWWTWGN